MTEINDKVVLLPCSCGHTQPTQMMAREICMDMNSPLWHQPQTRVWCIGCGAAIIKASAAEAISAWNRRAPASAVVTTEGTRLTYYAELRRELEVLLAARPAPSVEG